MLPEASTDALVAVEVGASRGVVRAVAGHLLLLVCFG